MRRRAAVVLLLLGTGAAGFPSGERGSSAPLRLPAPVRFAGNPDSPAPVTFRHDTHVTDQPKACLACHPRPFSMLRPVSTATHERMEKGDSCGACHDGQKAFGVAEEAACALCHAVGGGS